MSASPRPGSLTRTHTGNATLSAKDLYTAGSPKLSNPKDAKEKVSSSRVRNKLLERLNDHSKNDPFKRLIEEISNIIFDELKKEEKAIEGVKTFLKDDDVDDCLRWHLLYYAVNIDELGNTRNESKLPRLQLSRAIIAEHPYLSFENPSVIHRAKELYQKDCVSKTFHQGYKVKQTPLHKAAESGNAEAIEAMITGGKSFYDEDRVGGSRGFLRAMNLKHHKQLSPDNCRLVNMVRLTSKESGSTALSLAADADHGASETITKLLKVPDIAYNDETFGEAVEEGKLKIVEAFLGKDDPDLFRTVITEDSVKTALRNLNQAGHDEDNVENEIDASCNDPHRIAELLVSRIQDPLHVDDIAESIIATGSMKVWQACPGSMLSHKLKGHLVHLAVKHQRLNFVQHFLKEYPDSVRELWGDDKHIGEQYPLWYNNHDKEGNKIPKPFNTVRDNIRNEIVTKMIHKIEEMEKLSDAFNTCEVGQLCLDLSRFDSKGFRVSEFVDSMISQADNDLVTYEQTLRYVEFPPLDMLPEAREAFKDDCPLQFQHTEIFKILKWLRDKKKVQTIIKLKASDRLVNCHDQRLMAKGVELFNVKVLDWKVLDLCLDIFDEKSQETITDLCLYSSGNRAVISHWFSPSGFKLFKNLKTLKIYLIMETCTNAHRNAVYRELIGKIDTNDEPPVISVDRICWYPKQKLADLSKIAERIDPHLGRWLVNLKSKYEGDMGFKRTKVAILDNGVLSISPKSSTADAARGSSKTSQQFTWEINDDKKVNTQHAIPANDAGNVDITSSLFSRIKDGCSFVEGRSSHSPWHLACHPHGTQMANIICAIDPLCDIYVARVAEDAFGITAKRVEKAIAWAISKDVDIISMSFTIGEMGNIPELLNKASQKGIVMTCSTHDEGAKTQNAYPAGLKSDDRSLFVLVACDEYGRPIREIESDKFHYLIRGQKMAAGTIPFLKSNDTVDGSSVSTALAAGLCSLTLTCDRLQNRNIEYEPGWGKNSRYDRVNAVLKSMTSANNDKFILLNRFGKLNEENGTPSADRLLGKI
ncbi:hypothetical protein ACHAPO_011119 [Fusarium lateritium]